MSRGLAIGLLLLTGIVWSTGGFLIKLIPWPPLVIAGLRSGFTVIIIFFILVFKLNKNCIANQKIFDLGRIHGLEPSAMR